MLESRTFVYYIYEITSLITGLSYVGVTTKTPELRWKQHCSSAFCNALEHKCYFHKAIKHQGVASWKVSVIYAGVGSKESQAWTESVYIKALGTFAPHGYNTTYGGEGVPGRKATTEQRSYLSALHTGTHASEETRRKMSRTQKGRIFSDDHRRALSNAQKGSKNHQFGKSLTQAAKDTLSIKFSGSKNPFFGKHHTQETCDKLRKAIKPKFGSANSASKPVIVYGIPYQTIKDACFALSISRSALLKLLYSNNQDFLFT